MRLTLVWISLAAVALAADPAAPGESVRVGGRRVHVHCTGAGDTTVLLVSGFPRFSFHYDLVQSDLATTTRVCAYDKAGDAWTDPVPEFSADGLLAELDGVVRHVSRSKPLILVGHSFGGILARAYYGMHPDRVRGLVLVDTPHPDMIRMPVGGVSKKMYELTEEDMQTAAEMARKNNMKPMPPNDGKIAPPFDRLPANLHASHLWAMDKAAKAMGGIDPLVVLKVQSGLAKRIKDQRFTVPTIVITRAKTADEMNPWIDSQKLLADAASQGKLVRAAGSGHDIQLEQPQVITAAVRELLTR